MHKIEDEIKLDELQKWFVEEENLPKEIDRLLLKRFYHCMNGNMDEIKSVIKINYAMRNKNPNIFLNRDPLDEDTKQTNAFADIILIPGLTPENDKVSLFRLRDSDTSKIHHPEDTKTFFMISDCRFVIPDLEADENVLSEGEVQIFDLAGYSLKHLSKMNMGTLRLYIRFLQQAFPVRLRAIHAINCPPYMDKILAVVKPFISKEVYKMIHFHVDGIESLFEYVPQTMLPTEYGGNSGKIDELKANTMRILEEKREYLMDANYWKIVSSDAGDKKWLFF